MSPENWRRVNEIWEEALKKPAGEWEQFLNTACAKDPPEVRAMVEELLRSPDDPESLSKGLRDWVGRALQGEPTTVFVPAPVIGEPPTDWRTANAQHIRVKVLPDGDLQELLRKRLLFTAALVACLYAVYQLKLVMYYEGYLFNQYTFGNWMVFVLVHATTFVSASFAALLLWSNKRFSVRKLRVFEFVLVGLLLLNQSWLEYQRLFRDHRLLFYLQTGTEPVASGRTHVLPWFVLIIGYGVLIPNTGRRCFGVISAIAGVALAINLVAAITDGVVFHPAVLHHLLEVSLWLGCAVAFPAYNAYRIDHLRRFAGYCLQDMLGGGGMGIVYLAVNELLGRTCAIKLMRPELARDPQLVRRFKREMEKMAGLNHPNVVEVFDYGTADDGRLYYAMEYLEGWDLEKLVKPDRSLPPGRVVFLLRQVCSALAKVHTSGLIHRDIKPNNIIVCVRDGLLDAVKLIDFGIVRDEHAAPGEEDANPGAVVGAWKWMAPEQKKGGPVDRRSDLYSLGATAYFLLTGKTPDESDSHLADAPTDLQAVVLRCLKEDPEQRFQSAGELEKSLANCACATQWGPADAKKWWQNQGTAYQMKP